MIELARLTNPGGRGGENAEFWQAERKKLLRNILGLLLPVDGSVDLLRMNSLLNSAPHDFTQARSADWRSTSNLYKYLVAAEKLIAEKKIRKHEYQLIADYWLQEHPGADPRTRGNIVSDYTGLMDAFLRGKIYDLFCQKTTVTPDDILAGKIVVVALPVAGYYEVGRYAAGLWKYLLQRASERRSLVHPETIRPTFIWADEAQYFTTTHRPNLPDDGQKFAGLYRVLNAKPSKLLRRVWRPSRHPSSPQPARQPDPETFLW